MVTTHWTLGHKKLFKGLRELLIPLACSSIIYTDVEQYVPGAQLGYMTPITCNLAGHTQIKYREINLSGICVECPQNCPHVV